MATRSFENERQRIIDICTDLFARNGYHNTGLAELTRATGLGRGGFYHYIASKEELLYDIVATQIDDLNRQADVLAQENLAPEEHLRELARGLLRAGARNRAGWTVFFREFLALRGDHREAIVNARNRYEAHWTGVLRAGLDAGMWVAEPAIAAKAMLGAFNHTYLWFDPQGPLGPDELADHFVGLILEGLNRR